MKAKKIALSTAGLLLATGLGVLGGRALATGAPVQTPLTYAGTVTDAAGKPYPTAQSVKVSFYDKADATVAKCTSPQAQTEANTGHFSVVLPPECAQAVHEAPDLWTEATVGESKTVLPRTHVGAVPYALEADSAKQATTAVGAGGALKTTLDGLASDVAGLKAAPGGGGGPWVVDAKGVKVGTFLTSNLGKDFTLLTAGGYTLNLKPDGTSPAVIFFSGPNCTGNAYLDQGTMSNTFAVVGLKTPTYYSPPGGSGGFSLANKTNTKSYWFNPKACTNSEQVIDAGVLVMPISAASLGLPATITAPLTIQP